MMMEVNGNSIALDREGYLLDPAQWNVDVARALAAKENIELTENVWEVVNFVRDYYLERPRCPNIGCYCGD
jgi:tRNA 2-thiouridine synthesizing protein E